MTIRVFVCSNPNVPFGDSWEAVGTLDRGEPSIDVKAHKALQSVGTGGRVRISFYLSGLPDARWVRATAEHSSFAIVFDLLGDGTRVLVAARPAAVTALATRPPEPHPGLLVRPSMLPIKVNSTLRLA